MPIPTRVALATAVDAWSTDTDGPPLIDAFARADIRAEPVVWDAEADWAAFDLVVVRSTWDYVERRSEFLAWAAGLGTRVLNAPEVLEWNTDKRYLAALAGEGVPTVPTRFADPSGTPHADMLPASGGFVVKPAVSAGSRDTARYGEGASERERGLSHLRALVESGRTAMVQPYIEGVDDLGETGMLFFDGRFSHAFRKGPLLRVGDGFVEGLYAEEEITPRTPSSQERELGEAVLGALGRLLPRETQPLYARVDVLPTAAGPVVLEVELTEPSFFLHTDPTAADRFVEAVASRLRRS